MLELEYAEPLGEPPPRPVRITPKDVVSVQLTRAGQLVDQLAPRQEALSYVQGLLSKATVELHDLRVGHEHALALQQLYMKPERHQPYFLQQSVFVSSALARNFRACVEAAKRAPPHPDEHGMVWMEACMACLRAMETTAAEPLVRADDAALGELAGRLGGAAALLRTLLRRYIVQTGEYEALREDMRTALIGDGVPDEDGVERTYRQLLNAHARNSADEPAEFERSVEEALCGAGAAAERAKHVDRVEALRAERDAATRERVRARIERASAAAPQ